MQLKRIFALACLLVLMTSCTNAGSPASEATPLPSEPVIVETATEVVPTDSTTAAVETATIAETTVATDSPAAWLELPIIPELSPAMLEVYQRGLASGRDPHRFSKIGDCQNIPTYFLAMFDGGTYSLGDDYAYLKPTIDYFAGSWGRKSLAVKGGLNIIAVQNTMWTPVVEQYAKKDGVCKDGETPLVCELRDNNPSFAIISMEESWDGSLDMYDKYMRQIIDYVLSLDIVPVLATRSEILTQERQINDMVVKIAEDYDLPLWNFGAAAAKLPNAGLREDGFHLTPNDDDKPQPHAMFDDAEKMQYGWTWRNLTALQTMHSILSTVSAQ